MDSLGDELRRLRDEHRIRSQSELATLSGVSQSTIKLIESNKTITRPSTLRLLARGLAKDFDGKPDLDRTEAIYTRLMRAAEFLPPEKPPAEHAISRDAFIAEMAQRTGRRDLALALSSVAWDYETIPERYRKILETTILELAGAPEERTNE